MASSQKFNAQASLQKSKYNNIPDFSKATLLVVGDIMLDRYYMGATVRISPEAPVPIVKVNECEERPGGAANVAVNAAMLGANVTVMGFVGVDDAAQVLRTKLHARNILCDFIADPLYNTIIKLRVISRNQQLIRLDFETSFADINKSELFERYKHQLANVNMVVLSDYAKGTLSDVQSLIYAANDKGIPVVVDPKGASFARYRGASVITPNMTEFLLAQGLRSTHATDAIDVTESQLRKSAEACCQSNNIANILLTRSENGMSLFSMQNDLQTMYSTKKSQVDSNISCLHLPALAREVFDVTGAGDTVLATLACALGAGENIEMACQLANHAAGAVVGKLGTSSVTATELAQAINQHKAIDGGILNQEQLIVAVRQAQARGESIVMTNGCFDILHSGHVSYLSEASRLGDRLIVAINADASVTKLKGEGRPINNVNRRMSVIAGLASVDWVVEFTEDTPQRLIGEVLPNILVKGGDYEVESIAGAKEVIESGGKVLSLGFEDGVSTSAIIQQLTGE